MARRKRIRTVLYNDQRFSVSELDLIHTPALQRLYDLKQLGLTDRVFIDASHSRLQHVVGVMEQAENLMCSLRRNLARDPHRMLKYMRDGREIEISNGNLARYVDSRRRAVRLMALLHDLTHAPFGHTLEDEIRLVDDKHDEPERQADAFYRLLAQYLGWRRRDAVGGDWGVGSPDNTLASAESTRLAQVLDAPHFNAPPSETDTDFGPFLSELVAIGVTLVTTSEKLRAAESRQMRQFLNDLLFAMSGLLFLDIAHSANPNPQSIPRSEYPFQLVIRRILAETNESADGSHEFWPHRDAFLLDVIGNTICADLLDYAKRDSFVAGMKLDYDADRIVENFTVVSYWNQPTFAEGKTEYDQPMRKHVLRTAISVFSHKLRIDVPGELLNLLQVRFYVYERMLFHPTKSVAGAMLGAALQLIGWRVLPTHLRFVGDMAFLQQCRDAARLARDLISAHATDDNFDLAFVERIEKQLDASPTSQIDVLVAVKQLLRDRLPDTRSMLSRLMAARRIRPGSESDEERRATETLQTILARGESSSFDEAVKSIGAQIPGEPEFAALVVQVAADQLPTVNRVLLELRAALRLLDRLSARRYHKPVFRLLPNLDIGLGRVDARAVAELFLQPTIRMTAERAIEDRSGLPRGSVVIHCPVADGPRKIANILMVNGLDHSKAYVLRKISKLDPALFEKHEAAVVALEEMYESMWRLIVSVSPPDATRWQDYESHIAEVLYEIISDGQRGILKNDPYMTQELISRDDGTWTPGEEQVWITLPDGTEEAMPYRWYSMFKQAVPEFKRNGFFATFAESSEGKVAAVSGDADEAARTDVELLKTYLSGEKRKREPKQAAPKTREAAIWEEAAGRSETAIPTPQQGRRRGRPREKPSGPRPSPS